MHAVNLNVDNSFQKTERIPLVRSLAKCSRFHLGLHIHLHTKRSLAFMMPIRKKLKNALGQDSANEEHIDAQSGTTIKKVEAMLEKLASKVGGLLDTVS